MATNTPADGQKGVFPGDHVVQMQPFNLGVTAMSVTTESQTNLILGFLNARSCMILQARSSLRRWMTVTVSPNLVRNMASSRAESPPPMTAMC